MARGRKMLTDAAAIELVMGELRRQREQDPKPFVDKHQGYSVALEKLEDLREGVRDFENRDMRDAARELAAMAIRFMVDCT